MATRTTVNQAAADAPAPAPRKTAASALPASDSKWINPTENPSKAAADINKILSDTEMPVIDLPADDTVTLPGGLIRKDQVIKTVTVKELTGADEEALAKASQSLSPFVFLDRLLKCGVVQIGEEPVSDNEKLLKQMIIGDREALLLGIRKATYGTDLDVDGWICSNCGATEDLSMDIADIPYTVMPDARADIEFEVPFRKGGFAKVRLATGADQLAMFEKPDLTRAQTETIMLSRCITTIVDPKGTEHNMAGFPSMARDMSIPDRHAVLKELAKRQPGPKYDQVKYDCPNCSTEVNVSVTLANLFLELGWI
jgi:hypothetical protein